MYLLNFSHPFDQVHLAVIADLTGRALGEIQLRHIPTHFDHEQSFIPQVVHLVDSLGITPHSWQNDPILINPPAHNLIAVTLLAELHGRMGYFPPHLRLKPEPGALPFRFVVAEVVNLQAVRDAARQGRY